MSDQESQPAPPQNEGEQAESNIKEDYADLVKESATPPGQDAPSKTDRTVLARALDLLRGNK